ANLRGYVAGLAERDVDRGVVGHRVVAVALSHQYRRDHREVRSGPTRLVDLVPADPLAVRHPQTEVGHDRDLTLRCGRPRHDPLIPVELGPGGGWDLVAAQHSHGVTVLPRSVPAKSGRVAPATRAHRRAGGTPRSGSPDSAAAAWT